MPSSTMLRRAMELSAPSQADVPGPKGGQTPTACRLASTHRAELHSMGRGQRRLQQREPGGSLGPLRQSDQAPVHAGTSVLHLLAVMPSSECSPGPGCQRLWGRLGHGMAALGGAGLGSSPAPTLPSLALPHSTPTLCLPHPTAGLAPHLGPFTGTLLGAHSTALFSIESPDEGANGCAPDQVNRDPGFLHGLDHPDVGAAPGGKGGVRDQWQAGSLSQGPSHSPKLCNLPRSCHASNRPGGLQWCSQHALLRAGCWAAGSLSQPQSHGSY